MTVPALLYAALGPLVGNRVYPNRFPQPQANDAPTWPAIRYTILSEDPSNGLCGADPDNDDTRVRLDVVASTYLAMRSLKLSVISALESTDPPNLRQGGGFELFDAETKTHRAILEFVFYPSSTLGDSP